MLSPSDDYPIHQTGQPIAHPATGDRNHYDRYFFNGYDREGGFFFAAALGVYPNRRVIDAAFSIVHDGVQRSVHASGLLPLDRMGLQVGPIRVEVVEPLRTLRVVVEAAASGIEADVTFDARTPAVEEPRNISSDGTALRQDYTRATQWGTWHGSVTTGGTRLDCVPAAVLGTRDRSWGVRPVGEPAGGAPGSTPPQFFWLWAPLHFDDHCTHLALVDDARGRHTYESASRIPLLDGPGAPTYGNPEAIEHHRSADHDVEWEPGTRRARRASITMTPWRGEPDVIRLEPLLTFQMSGLGYLHPEWSHGTYKGEAAVGAEEWKLSEVDPLQFPNLHIQQLCTVDKGGQRGVGVLEQLVFGPHEPSGFTGLLDGAAG
jgi:hypothetical protein